MSSLIMVALLFGCSPEITEVERISNSTNMIDAIIAKRETDATVSTPTEIYLSQKSKKIENQPIFRADKVEGLQVLWSKNNSVIIRADSARVFLESSSQIVNFSGKIAETIFIEYEIKVKR